ncbi:MAG: hypothetical protein ACRENP_14655 [Longimicrobiales bacterium]
MVAGYAIHTVVPRAWALVWAALRGLQVPDEIPEEWLRAVRIEYGDDVPLTLRDAPNAFPSLPRRTAIAETNEHTVRAVKRASCRC